MTNTHAYSLTTLRCWSDWLGQVAGKLHVTGIIFKKYMWLVLFGGYLKCYQPTWVYLVDVYW